MRNPDGTGSLDRVLSAEVDATIAALKAFRPMEEIARRLGRVSHWVADLNQPLNTSASDPEEGRYFRDFALYADSDPGYVQFGAYFNNGVYSDGQIGWEHADFQIGDQFDATWH